MTIADTIMAFLRGINQIPGTFIFALVACVVFGYICGRAFTAETYWGRIWRGAIGGSLFLATFAYVAQVNIFIICFLLGFLFGVRVYVHAFLYWVWDFIVWTFGRVVEVANGFLKLFYYVARSIHDIIYGFSRMKMFSWEWDAKVKEANERAEQAAEREKRSSSFSQPNPDVEAARRAREEDLRRQQQGQQPGSGGYQEQTRTNRYAYEEARQERREAPPPRNLNQDEQRREAARVLGIDPVLFTFEDLRQAYRKKVRQLHPDQYEQLPEDIRRDLDDRLKAVNVAHDLLKKWKGWK